MAQTILIVDDSATIIMSMRNNLEIAGYDVVTAENGQIAYDKMKEGLVADLVITDINMPIMDGMELIQKVRALPNYRFKPILVLTTESAQFRKEDAKKLGASGWLVKPCGGRDLLNVIKKVLPE